MAMIELSSCGCTPKATDVNGEKTHYRCTDICVDVLIVYALEMRDATKITMNWIPVAIMTASEQSTKRSPSFTTST